MVTIYNLYSTLTQVMFLFHCLTYATSIVTMINTSNTRKIRLWENMVEASYFYLWGLFRAWTLKAALYRTSGKKIFQIKFPMWLLIFIPFKCYTSAQMTCFLLFACVHVYWEINSSTEDLKRWEVIIVEITI